MTQVPPPSDANSGSSDDSVGSAKNRQVKRRWLVVLGAVLVVAGVGFATLLIFRPDSPETVDVTVASPTPTPTSESITPEPEVSETPTAEPQPEKPCSPRNKLGDSNAIVYAPLDRPRDVTRFGSVSDTRAWSTSKVLVVMAFIKTVGDDDPENLSLDDQQLMRDALQSSDMNALLTLRGRIPGGSGGPMTEILRSIGDDSTGPWPNSREGSHPWSAREQVRFMAALANKDVVSPAASKWVRSEMKPIKSHRWGLGTVGSKTFKGGWLTAETDTRQMGLLDDYAVAIITDGEGPAVLQTDGDYAHVEQMNKLAKILKRCLEGEQDAGE